MEKGYTVQVWAELGEIGPAHPQLFPDLKSVFMFTQNLKQSRLW